MSIGTPPGSPEERDGWLNEDEWRDWQDSTERATSNYHRDQATFDRAQWAYDHRLPSDGAER